MLSRLFGGGTTRPTLGGQGTFHITGAPSLGLTEHKIALQTVGVLGFGIIAMVFVLFVFRGISIIVTLFEIFLIVAAIGGTVCFQLVVWPEKFISKKEQERPAPTSREQTAEHTPLIARRGEKHERETINLEGYEWIGCTFDTCDLIVERGNFRVFPLDSRTFNRCRLIPQSSALSLTEVANYFVNSQFFLIEKSFTTKEQQEQMERLMEEIGRKKRNPA